MKKNYQNPTRGSYVWLRKPLKIMKLTFFLILVSVMLVSAGGYSQNTKLSLSYKNIQIGQLLQLIEEQTQYRFAYSKSKLNPEETVSIEVIGEKLEQILRTILDKDQLTYNIIDRYVVISDKNSSAGINDFQQQQKNVSGKVTDSSGSTLPGVSVVVKGTTAGNITDSDGNYTLNNIPANSILQFSFIGMKTLEIPVAAKTTINVVMTEESVGLDEVVAIGYGTVKKSSLTSAISKIGEDAFRDRPLTSTAEGLQGQLAGVRVQSTSGLPGAEPRIRIRGVNTINGDSSPLYVVDGVTRSSISDLNPEDIKSITVLKDAASSAIYGARGGNGVILVVTKEGKGKASVSFDASYGWQKAEKLLPTMNKDQFLAYNIWYRNVSWLRADSKNTMNTPPSQRPGSYIIPDAWTQSTVDTDWQKAVTQTAPIQNYQVSASGQSDLGNIFFSAGSMDQNGILVNTYYKRTYFRLNGVLNVFKNLKVGINVAPTFSEQDKRLSEGKEQAFHHAISMNPLIALNQATASTGLPTGIAGQINPLERLKQVTDQTKSNTVLTTLWGELNLSKDIKFKTQYSYDYSGSVYQFFRPAEVNGLNSNAISAGSSYSSRNATWSIQNTLNFNKTIADAHHIDILLGQSSDKKDYYRIDAVATGWPGESIETLNVATTPTLASTERSSTTTASFFGRVNYDFKEKYLFSATVRRDGSSRFGSNNKWGIFPSFSAGWKINDELFMQNITWLSLLKLRASWGTSGNDRIPDYQYMALMSTSNKTSWGNAVVGGMTPSNIANEDLKWESTQSSDAGLDISLFKNRVQFNFDYYRNVTKDLLYQLSIPYTSGFSGYLTNIGSLENKGWEIDLTTSNLTGNLKWETSLNLSTNKQKVLDMGGNPEIRSASFDATFLTRVGGPVSQYLLYRTDGILTADDFEANGKTAKVPIMPGQEIGNYKYVDQPNAEGVKDGKITTADMVPYGDNFPDLTYGMTNSFSWKNFDLSIFIQGQLGGDIMFLGQRQFDNGVPDNNGFARWVNCWKPNYEQLYPGAGNPIPNTGIDMSWDGVTPNPFGKNDNNTDQRVYDTSFLRIKNITLAYNIPLKILNKYQIKSLRVYFSADNIKTFSDYPGLSPENDTYGNGNTRLGVDYSSYPSASKYSFGLNLTF